MVPRAYLVSMVLALLLAGCGGVSYKTAPVSGKVTLDGKPLAHATLMFVPAGGAAGDKDPPPSSAGTTDEEGHYSLVLSSGSKANGAVLGKHKVMIMLDAEAGAADTKPTFHKSLPERYYRRTILECDVPAGGKADADFALVSKP